MTIHFFLQSRDFGGAEVFARDLLLELARLGTKTQLHTTNPVLLKELRSQHQLQLEKIPVYTDFTGNGRGLLKSLVLSPAALLYYWRTLNKIKKETGEQIIVCSGFSEKILLSPLAHQLQLPIIFIEYGPLEPLFKKLYHVPQLLYNFAKKYANQVIVSSDKTKLALSGVFSKKKINLIRCGSPDLARKQLIKKKAEPTVALISRLEPGKGQDLAIEAWKKIADKPKNAQLLVIGRGSLETRLRQQAKNEPSIKFLSYEQDVKQILQNSTIALCPSVWDLEGFGLVVTEAMALSKPIIAFDRAPYNELIKHGRTALLAKDGDIDDLAKKIKQLLSDKALQKKLGEQARRDFLDKFQINQVAKNYLKLFTKVLKLKNAVSQTDLWFA